MYSDQIVHEKNGFFKIYDNGKLVKKYDLGCVLLNTDSVNYDDLEFGIYQVKNGKLIKVNKNGKKLLEQNDGLYFVPSPGYNVETLGELTDILPEVNKAIKAKTRPHKIEIKLII